MAERKVANRWLKAGGSFPAAVGFTLLEILVVVAIVAALAGAVMLSFTGADDAQRLRGLAEQLRVRLELARESALQRNREWGVHVQRNSYKFVEFDPTTGDWVEQSRRPFMPEGQTASIEFWLQVEGLELGGLLDASSEKGAESKDATGDLPDIIIFSSGEVTPFEWTLSPTWGANPWVVSNDGLATTEVAPKT